MSSLDTRAAAQAPTQALAHTLFGTAADQDAAHSHLHPLQSTALSSGRASKQAMVWLSWDDCRCLVRVFRYFEYVDALGKPTSLVDTLVSRLTAGEAAKSPAMDRPSESGATWSQGSGGGAGGAGGLNSAKAAGGSASGGASRLWGWGIASSNGSNNNNDGVDGHREESNGSAATTTSNGTHREEQVRTAAWQLLSSTFARATALRISAEAEEVAESDAQAVLTWFPRLEYLDIQSIPHAALRFWEAWMPDRLTCLKVEYAGLALDKVLGLRDAGGQQLWSHLVLLDLSRNPGIDLTPLSTMLPNLLPNVSRMSLAYCELESVPSSLVNLYSLSWLDLRGNAITSVTDISLKLGSIVRLDLSDNRIDDVSGLRRLWALEALDISDNRLDSWAAILVLRNMPSLSSLDIRGNPFTQEDCQKCRPQIFSAFDHRDIPLVLDGHGPTRQERREMARIPRVATGHHVSATATAPGVPAKRTYRAKVAVIEESADADLESDDGGGIDIADNESGGDGDGDGPESEYTAGSSTREAKDTSSPVRASILGPPEKTPHVLRAAELMAAHRRSNAANKLNPSLLATSPSSASPQLISMKSRPRTKRRATATTLGGLAGSGKGGGASHGGTAEQRAAAYFVPSSYNGRPASPAPSSLAPSMRTGASFLRDPEKYRRRVEMMRAEAGSSWLRAFAELQFQSRETSPGSPLIRQGSHFGQVQSSDYPFNPPAAQDGPGSDSISIKSDSRDPPHPTSSLRQDTNSSSNSDLSHEISDTQLPSFLFPRRKPATRKKEIPRLPHYSPEDEIHKDQDTNRVMSPQQAEASVVGLGIVDSEGGSLGSESTSSLGSPSSSQGSLAKNGSSGRGSGENISSSSVAQLQHANELARLRKGDSVRAALTDDIDVTHYGFVPILETSFADDRTVSVGSRVVQRMNANDRSVYVTSSELVEVASDREHGNSSPDAVGGSQIVSRTPLALVVRVKRPSSSSILVEVKGNRFDSPQWIEYTNTASITASGFSALIDAIQTASDTNAAQGLPEQVYKQAECLRCSWHGFIDHERTAFDALPDDKEFILLPPPPKKLQCPQCKREYLREFYADDERREPTNDGGNSTQNDVKPIWKRSFVSRRNRPGSAKRKTNGMAAAENEHIARRARQIAEAREIAHQEIERLGAAAVSGSLPFVEATNAIELFLQLSVFEADGERLKRWVPAGLVRQVYPMTPGGQLSQASRPSSSSNRGSGTGSKPLSGSKWGFSSLLGSTTSPVAVGDSEKDERLEGIPEDERRAHVIQSDWQASTALVPAIAEQAVYLALSSHAIYVFSLTWDALDEATMARRAEMDLQPEQHLGLLFSISLASLGRIDIGPNRQYLALHSSLLTLEEKTTCKRWGSSKLQQLLTTTYASYPVHGCSADHSALADAKNLEKSLYTNGYLAKTNNLRTAQHAPRCTTFQGSIVSSCVFLIRDRLACSDLLDSLVEIGYETNVLNSDVAGMGSGRLRAINHDVEWAMHHLVQQVFLRSTTFDAIDDDDDDDEDAANIGDSDRNSDARATADTAATATAGAASVGAMSKKLVLENRKRALRLLRHELLCSRSCQQPGALVDASSGDNVIVDKVTYEFLKLYFCVGCVYTPIGGSVSQISAVAASAPDGTTGILPLTLVGSPQFIYLVRERVDVWPPPVPDLRFLYRKWQRIAPPTIVTSNPDTYDPQALTEELSRRSNAPSSASTATSRPISSSTSAANSMGNHASGSSTVRDERQMIGDNKTHSADPEQQLISSAVTQYDSIIHARPIADVCQITLLSKSVAVSPQQQASASSPPASASSEKQPRSSPTDEVFGCTGSGWHAMVHIKFANATNEIHASTDPAMHGWSIWFATQASAEECVEALAALAKSSGATDVEICVA
ncbi:hypothetical protein EV178_000649 [Coemansia sp. RSA 1646]|nr:hypothetical protein EV178_000649 [Coemansia sp. RSA 1646]